ncbi:MAG: hypothetical protein JWR09_2541 [Mucilaginibacter sp.]|nr:hypothetical protein [Mucilaginibacter sp.]
MCKSIDVSQIVFSPMLGILYLSDKGIRYDSKQKNFYRKND